MTDYKNLKLIATSSPHIRAAENTRSIMLDVIIAMVPALAYATWQFGFEALLLTAVIILLAVILPGNEFLPLASLAGMFYVFPVVRLCSEKCYFHLYFFNVSVLTKQSFYFSRLW